MVQHFPITETMQLAKTGDAWNIRCWFRNKVRKFIILY